MGFRRVVALLLAACFLLLSSFISWYEGAKLLDIPWEWEHTALFSAWFHGEVNHPNDIIAIDHFLYAAKFQPLFPFLMITSALVILFQLASWLFRYKDAAMNGFLLGMAMLFLGTSASIADSPTAGFSFFTLYFAALGIFSLLHLLVRWAKKEKTVL